MKVLTQNYGVKTKKGVYNHECVNLKLQCHNQEHKGKRGVKTKKGMYNHEYVNPKLWCHNQEQKGKSGVKTKK